MDFQSIKNSLAVDGVALIPGLLKNGELELLKASIEYGQKHPSPFGRTINQEGATFFNDFWTYQRNQYIRKILGQKYLSEVLRGIIPSYPNLRFFHDHILVKSPGAISTPWHQDRPYYVVDGPENFSIWITPDEILEDNSLAFICGSHLSGREYTPVSFSNSQEMGIYEGLFSLTNEEITRLSYLGIKIFRMNPGDALIFNNRTVHRSLSSSAKFSRSALSLRFICEDSWLTRRFINPAPPFHKMGLTFEEGDRCPDKWFPKFSTFKDA
jgi:hypothetical protein